MIDLDWCAWIERSPALAKVTPAALADSLDGFRLGSPMPGMGWLARAVQGALLFTVPVLRDVQSPVTGECCVIAVPNATEAKKIYRKLSRAADALLAEMIRNSDLIAYQMLTPDKFSALYGEVERAAGAFSEAAGDKSRLAPRWREKRAREDRVERATLLSPIFERAYGATPAVNTYPGSDGGPWPDFYQRVTGLVFGETEIPDLEGVLSEARKAALLAGVTFAPGQIPEYPL